jgi:hypothetical protein
MKMVPLDKYILTFKHEIIDEDGEAHLLDEPLVIKGIINPSFARYAEISPVNEMIHNMFDRMECEVLCKYGDPDGFCDRAERRE